MKGSLNTSQELRQEIQNLVQARESLQKNVDISGSMVKITRSLNNVQPLMNKQTQYIKNFLQSGETNDATSKESESRRYVARICDITIGEMTELLGAAEQYFTLEVRTSWLKLRNEFERLLQIQREQVDKSKSNIVELMFKVVNMKDKLMKEFLRSLVYRKCLLWKDLNIVSQGFVHSEKKKITKTMQDYITNKRYAPTRPLFTLPDLNISGLWSLNKQELEDSSLAEFLKLVNEEMEQIFDTVRNYSGLNEQQRNHQDIRRNQSQVKSLRAQIEQTHFNYQLLERKYREAVSKDQKMDIVEMKEKLKAAEDALELKDRELKELTYSYRDYTRDMNSQKEKIKELQADLEKITAVQLKKLKEVEMMQFSLSEEFSRIHKNMNNFGSMFEFESEGKKSLADQIISLKATVQKMAGILGAQKNANLQLKQQIHRLNLVILELGSQLRQHRPLQV